MPTVTAHAEPCVLVIFGASGDLTHRKLVPSLSELERQGRLPEGMCVIGVSRTPMSDDEFREKMKAACREFDAGFEERAWRRLAERLHYLPGDAAEPMQKGGRETYAALSARIEELARARGIVKPSGSPNILFYLSVAPSLYEPIIENIGASGLVREGKRWCAINPADSSWQRIIVEKPFGSDLESAESLNRALGRVFEEEDTFRIDHYLGKELVQNILVMRFANTIFEPIWNRSYIDHVQVTAAEKVGVGSRAANFYDQAGALRDMVQSHLLQILALVAMEPPSLYDAASIMREKIKLFGAAKIVSEETAPKWAVFGRYGPDASKGEPAYVDEKGVDPSRGTETYAAMRLEFDNWRWAGVPIFLRSGKKLAEKLTEVVVQFKRPPTNPFAHISPSSRVRPPNRMIISIAPRESISIRIEGKVPGNGKSGSGGGGMAIDSAELELDYLERFGGEPQEAYGPLLLDAMRGDRTLFKHRDEVESGWRIVQPFLESRALRESIETYEPGTWGPAGADELIARGSPEEDRPRRWHNPGPGADGN